MRRLAPAERVNVWGSLPITVAVTDAAFGPDLRTALDAAERLNEADRLRLWQRLSESLTSESGDEVGQAHLLTERVAALDALTAEYERRGLVGSGRRLTARDFNEGCRATGSVWNATRVVRAWGRWRTALDVLHGARAHDRIGERAARLTTGFARRSRQDARQAIADWVATKPQALANHAYDTWAKERNASLSPEKLPYPGSSAVRSMLGTTTFAGAVRRAVAERDGDTPPKAAERTIEDYSLVLDGHRLVNRIGASLLLGWTEVAVRNATREGRFPVVALLGRASLYLAEDIERFGKGQSPKSVGDEFAGRVQTVENIAVLRGVSQQAISLGIQRSSPHYPQPQGKVGRAYWWDAKKTHEWFAEHPEYAARRKRRVRAA
ncbi:hypothetical protein [Baekduia sp. Peel2402]|uniref:hypothetical protein n=1 Tax=Baekduia sp. Peel2402 TaxID=3458296 RepID=UPI00403EE36D